jgi:hypothetical protein
LQKVNAVAGKLTIFISGTMRDLLTERARVAAAIQDMGLEPIWAEKRGATDRPSRDECEWMAGLRALAEESGTRESVRRAARGALERLER